MTSENYENFRANMDEIKHTIKEKFGAFSDRTEDLLEGEFGLEEVIKEAFFKNPRI